MHKVVYCFQVGVQSIDIGECNDTSNTRVRLSTMNLLGCSTGDPNVTLLFPEFSIYGSNTMFVLCNNNKEKEKRTAKNLHVFLTIGSRYRGTICYTS